MYGVLLRQVSRCSSGWLRIRLSHWGGFYTGLRQPQGLAVTSIKGQKHYGARFVAAITLPPRPICCQRLTLGSNSPKRSTSLCVLSHHPRGPQGWKHNLSETLVRNRRPPRSQGNPKHQRFPGVYLKYYGSKISQCDALIMVRNTPRGCPASGYLNARGISIEFPTSTAHKARISL